MGTVTWIKWGSWTEPLFGGKGHFWCLVGPRLGLHFLLNAVDLVSFPKGPFWCLVGPRVGLHFLLNAVDLVSFPGKLTKSTALSKKCNPSRGPTIHQKGPFIFVRRYSLWLKSYVFKSLKFSFLFFFFFFFFSFFFFFVVVVVVAVFIFFTASCLIGWYSLFYS